MEPSTPLSPEARLQVLTHSDFWFPDGNIVLVAGNFAFKVHRGQLERHSEVFSNLFSIPQPAQQDLLEGCPWVELHDSPPDVFHFLKALYDGLYFQYRCAKDFSSIAAVLRLSTKYFVEHLRQHCMMRLELDWPSTLARWDRREKEATDLRGRYSPRDVFAHPILAIELAQELGLTTMLAAAFYDLSRYEPSKIMMGTPRPSPAVAQTAAAGKHDDASPPRLGDHTHIRLSRDFLHRTFRGRESAQKFVGTFIERELRNRPVVAGCANKAEEQGRRCRESFYFIILNILRSVGGIASGRNGDALFTLMQAVEMMSRTDFSDGQKQCSLKICEPCKVDFATTVDRARDEVWELIPGWFGLGSRPRQTIACGKVD